MSVKGVIRAIKTSILVTAVLRTTIMATGGEGEQAQAIMPGGSDAEQKHVMSVIEMCWLLKTAWVEKKDPDWLPGITKIRNIKISMEEISAKEKDFANKVAPTTETVGGQVFEIVYRGIRIIDRTTQDSSHVIESKHIRALSRFLQMFAGCRVEILFIEPQNVTQNKEELQKIRGTLSANPWVCVPINVKLLRLNSVNKAKTMHPVLLQVVIPAVGNSEAAREEVMGIYITIAVNHIQQAIQSLGSLKCKKVKEIRIRLNNNEQGAAGELSADKAAEEMEPAEVVHEWGYEVEYLEVSSNYHNVSAILPAWLVGKPTRGLALDMCQYTCLSKEEVQSIRAPVLWVQMRNKIDLNSIESYAAQKKSEGVTNAQVTVFRIDHQNDFTEQCPEKEEFLKHIRRSLAWAATQFPRLTEINLYNLNSFFVNNTDLYQAICEMAVEFNPKMQNLEKVVIWGKEVYVVGSEYVILRKMPFVFHSKLWQAFTRREMEAQINRQQVLEEDQEGYIRLQAWASDKDTEQFRCPICMEVFDENEDSSWIYVTWPCRHAFCLKCMNDNYKTRYDPKKGSETPQNTMKCMMHNDQVLKNWWKCVRIEEAENNTYSVIPSYIEEELLGEKEILVVEY